VVRSPNSRVAGLGRVVGDTAVAMNFSVPTDLRTAVDIARPYGDVAAGWLTSAALHSGSAVRPSLKRAFPEIHPQL
jgi:hypothetical protein